MHFYWRRGERIIPRGHRSGHLEPTRFQINDRPHSQIRITQQLPQVQRPARTEVLLQSSMCTFIKVSLYLKLVIMNHCCFLAFSRYACACACSSPPWRTRTLLRSQRSPWLPMSCLSLEDSMTTTSSRVNVEFIDHTLIRF